MRMATPSKMRYPFTSPPSFDRHNLYNHRLPQEMQDRKRNARDTVCSEPRAIPGLKGYHLRVLRVGISSDVLLEYSGGFLRMWNNR